MSLRIDKVQLEIIINNDEARKRLRALDTDIKTLSKELARLPEGTEEFIAKSAQLKSVEAEYEKLKREIGITGMSLKELQNHQRELNMVMLHMDPRIPEYKILQRELRETTTRVNELRNGARQMPTTMQQLGDSFNRYQSVLMAAGVALMGIIYTFNTFIQGGAELSDSLADIQKTTDMTAQEVRNLNSELGKIDTRTSRKELRDMAIVAGQLGIAKKDIYDFVQSVDVLNVALGDEITGGAGEVAKVMGTLRNVLTDMKSTNVSQDMMRIGDAINELGKAGFATAPVIADFANRIGGIGIPLGLTSDEILGLSATLQELNINTERGGTAVGRILQKMARNTGDFAKVAGIPIKEFTDMVNTDLMGAFIKVMEGTKRGGINATVLAGIIKELEVQGAGASEVFAKLGGNVAMLNEKMDLAGKTLQSSTSSTDEFNIKNQTMGAIVDKLVKSLYGLIMLPSLQELFKGMIMTTVSLVAWFKELPQTIEKYKVALTLLSAAIGIWIASVTRGIQVQIWNNLVTKEGWLLSSADLALSKLRTAWERLYTFAKSEGTIATKAATASQWLWNAALAANPIGLLIGLFALGVAAIKAYDKYNAESVAIEEQKSDALIKVSVLTSTAKTHTDSYAASIRALNNLSRDKKISLRAEIDLMLENNKAELESLKLKRQLIFAESLKLTLWQKLGYAIGGLNGKAAEDIVDNANLAVKDLDETIKAYEQSVSVAIDQKKTLDDVLNAEAQGDAIGISTLEEMDAKMSKYQIALRNLTKGGEDYLRVQQKIKDLNKLRNVETPDSKPDKSEEKALKDRNKLLEEYQRLMLELQAFEVKQLEERMNMYSKEVYAVERKYDTEIEKAKKFLAENEKLSPKQKRTVQQGIDVLEVQKGQAVKDELLKQETVFTTDVIAIRNKLKATQLIGYEKELQEIENTYNKNIEAVTGQSDAITKYYDDEIAKAYGNALLIIDLENQKQNHITNAILTTAEYEKLKAEEVAALKEKKARDLEDEIQKIQEGRTAYNLSQEQREIAEIDSKYARLLLLAEGNEEAKMRIEKMYADEIADYKANKSAETQRKINAFLVDQAQLLSNTVFEIVNNNNRSELDSRLAALSSQKERELSSKSLTEAQKAEIEAKYKRKEAAVKTKAWKDEQKAALVQAVINGALAITMILATTPKFDFGVATALLIGASIASTIAAVAKITSQKPPQFKAGGYTGDGAPEVPAGVVHKGEYVIPASLVKEPDIARQIKIIETRRKNTSGSQYATGGAVGSFADFNYPVIQQAIRSAPMQANLELLQRHTQQIIHQINIPQLIEKSLKQTSPAGTMNLEKVIGELTKKLEVMDQLKKKLDMGIRSHIVYQDIVDAQDTIKAIKSDTSR